MKWQVQMVRGAGKLAIDDVVGSLTSDLSVKEIDAALRSGRFRLVEEGAKAPTAAEKKDTSTAPVRKKAAAAAE